MTFWVGTRLFELEKTPDDIHGLMDENEELRLIMKNMSMALSFMLEKQVLKVSTSPERRRLSPEAEQALQLGYHLNLRKQEGIYASEYRQVLSLVNKAQRASTS